MARNGKNCGTDVRENRKTALKTTGVVRNKGARKKSIPDWFPIIAKSIRGSNAI